MKSIPNNPFSSAYLQWRISKMSASRRFCFIATVPRSGSNFLASKLNETHMLGYSREFFSRKVTRGRYPGKRPTILRQFGHALDEGTSPNGVTTIKLHPYQFRPVDAAIDFQRCFAGASWIWLRRKDRLSQAVSHEIAAQTGQWISHMPGEHTPVYSRAAIEARLDEIENGESEWQAYFVRNDIAPLCLWYEDICEDPDGAVSAVADFMKIRLSPSPGSGDRKNRYAAIEQQASEVNQEWKLRFQSETLLAGETGFGPGRDA